MIDGAGPLRILWLVILPQSLPALVAITVFHIVWAWNDFFGPLNLATLSQPIYFAKFGEPADRTGRSVFGDDPASLLAQVPMLSLHGRTNGLADPDNSARLLQSWALVRGLDLQSESFDGMGHQDLLIGNKRGPVFERIETFFK